MTRTLQSQKRVVDRSSGPTRPACASVQADTPSVDKASHDEAARLIAESRADEMLASMRNALVTMLLTGRSPSHMVETVVRPRDGVDAGAKRVITLHIFSRWGGA